MSIMFGPINVEHGLSGRATCKARTTGTWQRKNAPASIEAGCIRLKKLKRSKSKNAGGMTKTADKIANEVAAIYSRLDEQIKKHPADCSACGNCCDFESFGHRLFVSSPEIVYLKQKLQIKPMSTSRCPYQLDGKCTIGSHRFAACRIFFCKADEQLQSRLSEETLNQFKSLCIQLALPYRYTDLATALNGPPA